MNIAHCICHNVTFAQIKELAAKLGTVELEALQKKLPFCMDCKTCLPYIRRTLKTGETSFSEFIIDDV